MRLMNRYAVSLFAAACLSGGAAAAADYTFTVPIEVSNLPPNIIQMKVTCMVTQGRENTYKMIGSGFVMQPVRDHGFSGDVTVAFDANIPAERTLAKDYECQINSFWTGGNRLYYSNLARTQPDRFFPLASGAPYTYSTGYVALP